MFSGRTTTTVEAPARGPMDLNSGAPNWRELGPLMGLVLLLVLPTGLGLSLLIGNWPMEGRQVSAWNLLWLAMGGTLMLVFGSFIWTMQGAIRREITDFQDRRREWHDAELDKFVASSGMVSAVQVSEWTYTEADMRHIGLMFLWLLLNNPKSLSIDKLTRGPLMLDIGHRSFKLMDMSQDGAESFLNLMARAGLIAGRGPRRAGSLVMMDAKQAALRLLTEASRNPAVLSE